VQTRESRSILRHALVLMATFAVLALAGCAGYQVVNEGEYEMLLKVRSGEYQFVKKEELDQLKRDADIGKSVGRYQAYRQGYRTWRLDTSTGETCLLLTTEADWKNPETTARSCY